VEAHSPSWRQTGLLSSSSSSASTDGDLVACHLSMIGIVFVCDVVGRLSFAVGLHTRISYVIITFVVIMIAGSINFIVMFKLFSGIIIIVLI
jgi:hypothetical protein